MHLLILHCTIIFGSTSNPSRCIKFKQRGSSHASDLPYPSLLYTMAPHPVCWASFSGKSRHIETQPRPSCKKTSVGASSGGGPYQIDSSFLPFDKRFKTFENCGRCSSGWLEDTLSGKKKSNGCYTACQ